jgi:8-oxo-dGTP pyrophosphatase MutT (NUDIX family)
MEDKFSNPWQTIATRIVYENPWISVREDQVIRPDGAPGIYGVVEFKNIGIGIVPLDDAGNVHLIGQYRYTLHAYSWEIPEGGCPENEEPLAAAQRELLEETGLEARAWRLMGRAHLSNSVTDEIVMWYLATELIHGKADPEGTEKLEHRSVPFDEAVQMIERGEITDALSILALLHCARLKAQGKI